MLWRGSEVKLGREGSLRGPSEPVAGGTGVREQLQDDIKDYYVKEL